MSPDSLRNPFHPPDQTLESSAHLMSTYLPSAEAQALTEALGEEESSKPEPQQDLPPVLDISMSGEEQREVEKEPLWIKEDYIKWAESFGKDEAWVNETFKFQLDGTTVVNTDLILEAKEIKQLPVGLIEIKGNLNVSLNVSGNPSFKLNGYPKRIGGYFDCSYNDLSSLQGMPEEVDGDIYLESNKISFLDGLPNEVIGDLYLSYNQLKNLDGISKEIFGNLSLTDNNQLTSLEALKGVKIGQDLSLRDIPATEVPAGIQIRGNIVIRSSQIALITDARAKGYQVEIV